jgi:hypothetical protein
VTSFRKITIYTGLLGTLFLMFLIFLRKITKLENPFGAKFHFLCNYVQYPAEKSERPLGGLLLNATVGLLLNAKVGHLTAFRIFLQDTAHITHENTFYV